MDGSIVPGLSQRNRLLVKRRAGSTNNLTASNQLGVIGDDWLLGEQMVTAHAGSCSVRQRNRLAAPRLNIRYN